jgi:hypothetical protein
MFELCFDIYIYLNYIYVGIKLDIHVLYLSIKILDFYLDIHILYLSDIHFNLSKWKYILLRYLYYMFQDSFRYEISYGDILGFTWNLLFISLSLLSLLLFN